MSSRWKIIRCLRLLWPGILCTRVVAIEFGTPVSKILEIGVSEANALV